MSVRADYRPLKNQTVRHVHCATGAHRVYLAITSTPRGYLVQQTERGRHVLGPYWPQWLLDLLEAQLSSKLKLQIASLTVPGNALSLMIETTLADEALLGAIVKIAEQIRALPPHPYARVVCTEIQIEWRLKNIPHRNTATAPLLERIELPEGVAMTSSLGGWQINLMREPGCAMSSSQLAQLVESRLTVLLDAALPIIEEPKAPTAELSFQHPTTTPSRRVASVYSAHNGGKIYLEIVTEGESSVRVQPTTLGQRKLDGYWRMWLRQLILDKADAKFTLGVEVPRGSRSMIVSGSLKAASLMQIVARIAGEIRPLPPLRYTYKRVYNVAADLPFIWDNPGQTDEETDEITLRLKEAIGELKIPPKVSARILTFDDEIYISLTRPNHYPMPMWQIVDIVEYQLALVLSQPSFQP